MGNTANTLSAKLLQEVQKSLPAMAAGEMKEFIEQACKDKERMEYLERENKELEEAYNKLRREQDSVERESIRIDGMKAGIKERERKVEQKERNQQVAEMQLKLECAESKTSTVKEMMNLVFKNTIVREGICSSVGSPVKDQYGNESIQYSSDSKNKTTEKE